MEEPQRRDPREAKELDYARHRRSAAEYPHAWRRQLPRKKANAERAFRRDAAETLRAARGAVRAERAERAEQAGEELDDLQRQKVTTWTVPTLREHVARVLDNRVERLGWNYFKTPYDSARHRGPFAYFLAALTAGRQGYSHDYAQRFARILATPPALASGLLGSWPPDPSRIHRWLLEFFADEPEWEQRLCDWIAQMPDDPGSASG